MHEGVLELDTYLNHDGIQLLYGAFAEALKKRLHHGAIQLMVLDRWERHELMSGLDLGLDVDPLDRPLFRSALSQVIGVSSQRLRPVLRRIGREPLNKGTYARLARLLAANSDRASRALTQVPEINQSVAEVALALPVELIHPRMFTLVRGSPRRAKCVAHLYSIATAKSGGRSRDLINSLVSASDWRGVGRILAKATAPTVMQEAPWILSDDRLTQLRSPVELVALGHGVFKNCLASRGYEFAGSGSLFYLWNENGELALISVVPDSGHGWRLDEIVGPSNRAVSEDVRRAITGAFQKVGISFRPSTAEMLQHFGFPGWDPDEALMDDDDLVAVA